MPTNKDNEQNNIFYPWRKDCGEPKKKKTIMALSENSQAKIKNYLNEKFEKGEVEFSREILKEELGIDKNDSVMNCVIYEFLQSLPNVTISDEKTNISQTTPFHYVITVSKI